MPKADQIIADANAVVTQYAALVGIVGLGVRATIALLRAAGKKDDAAEFEAEMGKYDAQLAAAKASVAEFQAKYPEDPDVIR